MVIAAFFLSNIVERSTTVVPLQMTIQTVFTGARQSPSLIEPSTDWGGATAQVSEVTVVIAKQTIINSCTKWSILDILAAYNYQLGIEKIMGAATVIFRKPTLWALTLYEELWMAHMSYQVEHGLVKKTVCVRRANGACSQSLCQFL